jgi:hypothetical protein
MDSLQHWGGLYFTVEAVSRFLANYRNQYQKHTKYKELEIALCFVLFLSRDQRKEYLIGFPTVQGLENDEPVTLAKIFERKIVLDEDFDIVIAPKQEAQQKNHQLQIVRFTGNVEGNTENLFSFLKEKKFNISKDENLILLVSLEKDFRFNYIELNQRLEKTNMPYGQIFIMGQIKPENSYVLFCYQVFPEIKRLRDLDFSFLMKAKESKT